MDLDGKNQAGNLWRVWKHTWLLAMGYTGLYIYMLIVNDDTVTRIIIIIIIMKIIVYNNSKSQHCADSSVLICRLSCFCPGGAFGRLGPPVLGLHFMLQDSDVKICSSDRHGIAVDDLHKKLCAR